MRPALPVVSLVIVSSALHASCSSDFKNEEGAFGESQLQIVEAKRQISVSRVSQPGSLVVAFDTTEGTNMNIDVSPDGETLVFDLLGDIYLLPIEGGDAIALTSGRDWDQAPLFSPDGMSVYFVSDRVGHKNLWRVMLSDSSVEQITHSNFDIMGAPNWGQGRSRLLAGVVQPGSRRTEFILYDIDPNSGKMTPIDEPAEPVLDFDGFKVNRPPINIFSGTESEDGEVYFSQAKFEPKEARWRVQLHSFDKGSHIRKVLTQTDSLYNEYKPQLSHRGEFLAYFRQYSDRRTELRVKDRTNNIDRAITSFENSDDAFYSRFEDSRPHYAFTPDDRSVILWHDGDIYRVNITTGAAEVIPFRVSVVRDVWERALPAVTSALGDDQASIVRWPSISRDGTRMVFAANGYVWVMNRTTNALRRLTDSTDFEYMPAISPNGRNVAFTTFSKTDDGTWTGRLVVAEIEGGPPWPLLANPNELYVLPKWSNDGERIAAIREIKGEDGTEAEFGWTLAGTGEFHAVAPAPSSDHRLGWSSDSRFVSFDSTDRQLLFSFRRSVNEVVLATAGLDGSSQRTIAIGTSEVVGIAPSPDLRHLALTRHNRTVWLLPFDSGSEQSSVSASSNLARKVSVGGGYYINWNRTDQLTYGLGNKVYPYNVGHGKEEPIRVALSFTDSKEAQQVAFTGGRVVTVSDEDGVGPVIEVGTVVVSGRRIIAVGRKDEVEIPQDAVVVDATGKTIMPGLLDTHYHRIGGWSLSSVAFPNSEFSDQSALAYGVTTAWEPGGAMDDAVPATADLQRSGRISGPRWSHAAMGVVGYPWEQLDSYDRALAAASMQIELGVAVLKEYNTPTRQQQQWLSTAARQRGVGIVSHIQDFAGMMTRIIDGYTGGDHPYIPVPYFNDVHQMLRQTGYIWTPNIVITVGTIGSQKDTKSYFLRDSQSKRWKEEVKLAALTGGSDPKLTTEQQRAPYHTHRVSRVAKQAAFAAKNGIHIGISAHNMPAFNVHREMWLLWKGGLSIEEVLRAATIGNAEKLGLETQIGSLEVGKVADLLVLDENPLDDIRNTLSLKYTVQAGVLYDSETGQRVQMTSSVDVGRADH